MILTLIGMVIGAAHAAPRGLAVGAQLGEPVAATIAYRWTPDMTVQLSQGWSFGQKRMHTSLDYLYTFAEIPADEGMGLRYPVYVGAGLRLRAFGGGNSPSDDPQNFGLRFPVGAAVSPDHIPIEVYFEMAPVWVMAPRSQGGFDGGIGGRLFF
mgnify:CR=1 FL=1